MNRRSKTHYQAPPYVVNDLFPVFGEVLAEGRNPNATYFGTEGSSGTARAVRFDLEKPEGSRPAAKNRSRRSVGTSLGTFSSLRLILPEGE